MTPRGVGCPALGNIRDLIRFIAASHQKDSAKAKRSSDAQPLPKPIPSKQQRSLLDHFKMTVYASMALSRGEILEKYDELLRCRSSMSQWCVSTDWRPQRTRDDIQPPTSCIKSTCAVLMAKSRGIRIFAVRMTLFLRNNYNNTSSIADIDHVVLEVTHYSLYSPVCVT